MLSGGLELVVPGPPSNSVATGAPTIGGTVQVGETLAASTSDISDADGLANATFTYQWLADRHCRSATPREATTPWPTPTRARPLR